MTLVVLNVDTEVLPVCTDTEFADWVRYQVGHSCQLSLNNPLSDYDLEADVLEIGLTT